MAGKHAADDPFALLARTYEDWFTTALGAFVDRAEMSALDRLIPHSGAGTIIELGAGTGHVARHLAALGFRVIAVEPSVAMQNEGRSRSESFSIEWHAAVAEALPFAHDTADGVLFFAALEFVRDPDAALCEALRVVRPGGWIAVASLHALSPWSALYRHLADRGDAPWSAARFFTPEELARKMRGPPVAEARAIHFAPYAEPPYEEAEQAGRRAGNAPALQLLLWRKTS